MRNIRRGCCTTFSTIKPQQVPATLELHQKGVSPWPLKT
jgi:hypothetical protein